MNGQGGGAGSGFGELGRALARERAGGPLPSPEVISGVLAQRRRRRLARFVSIARFFGRVH